MQMNTCDCIAKKNSMWKPEGPLISATSIHTQPADVPPAPQTTEGRSGQAERRRLGAVMLSAGRSIQPHGEVTDTM